MHTEAGAKKEILASNWNVKNVKFIPGHDGDAMSCTLYFNDLRVASVFYDSRGGEYQYRLIKPSEPIAAMLIEFGKFAEQFTVPWEINDDGCTYNRDILIDILINAFPLKREGWNNDLIFTTEDWKDEVMAGATRRGYDEWVAAKMGYQINK